LADQGYAVADLAKLDAALREKGIEEAGQILGEIFGVIAVDMTEIYSLVNFSFPEISANYSVPETSAGV